MKRTLLTIALVVVAMAGVAQNNVQEQNTKRGPYLTNKFFDNWFLSVGAGAQTYYKTLSGENLGTFRKRLTPEFDVSLGKWVTPSVGVRAQWQGVSVNGYSYGGAYQKGSVGNGIFRDNFRYSFVHADFLYNLSNAIGGFREDRCYNLIPFIGFGWVGAWNGDKKVSDKLDSELAASVGLLNTFRVCKALTINLELKSMIVREKIDGQFQGGRIGYLPSVSAGLTYKFRKRDWNRVPVCQPTPCDYTPYNNRIKAVEDELAAAKAQIDRLQKELDDCRNQAPCKEVAVALTPVFFKHDSYAIGEEQKINIKNIAEVIKSTPGVVYDVNGHSNKIGGAEYNLKLSERRANAVYNELIANGVDAEQLKVVAYGQKDYPYGNSIPLNRVVIVKEVK